MTRTKKGSKYCDFCGVEVETKTQIKKASVTRQFGKSFKRICADCDEKNKKIYSE